MAGTIVRDTSATTPTVTGRAIPRLLNNGNSQPRVNDPKPAIVVNALTTIAGPLRLKLVSAALTGSPCLDISSLNLVTR